MSIHTLIYKHGNEKCPLCQPNKKRKSGGIFRSQCESVGLFGENAHNGEWILRCGGKYKKCPGYKTHKRLLKKFKGILLEHSRKASTGRFLALDPIRDLLNSREWQGCFDYYKFAVLRKTKKNRKKKMWKQSEEWYVRKSS